MNLVRRQSLREHGENKTEPASRWGKLKGLVGGNSKKKKSKSDGASVSTRQTGAHESLSDSPSPAPSPVERDVKKTRSVQMSLKNDDPFMQVDEAMPSFIQPYKLPFPSRNDEGDTTMLSPYSESTNNESFASISSLNKRKSAITNTGPAAHIPTSRRHRLSLQSVISTNSDLNPILEDAEEGQNPSTYKPRRTPSYQRPSPSKRHSDPIRPLTKRSTRRSTDEQPWSSPQKALMNTIALPTTTKETTSVPIVEGSIFIDEAIEKRRRLKSDARTRGQSQSPHPSEMSWFSDTEDRIRSTPTSRSGSMIGSRPPSLGSVDEHE